MKQKVLYRILLVIVVSISLQGYAKGEKAKCYAFLFQSDSEWVQEDSVVRVTYDVKEGDNTDGNGWDYRYPYVIVTIKNKTMKPIYIDLGQCFLVKGEESYMYYIPGETHTTTGTSSGVGVNLGSVAGAAGIGGAVGTIANGVNVGGGHSSSTTSITYTQRIITIPPMSAKVLPKMPLVSYFRDQSNNIAVKDFGGAIWVGNVNTAKNPNLYLYKPKMQPISQGEHLEFSPENSPIAIHTYISYSLTDDCGQTITLPHNCFVRYIIGTKNDKRSNVSPTVNNKSYEKELNQYIPDRGKYRDILVYGSKRLY